jgi:hypothetical protein
LNPRGHESGHLSGLRHFGYTADSVTFDFRWADFGHFGSVDGLHRVSGDAAREPFDRSVLAALGPVLGGTDLDHPSAAADLRCIDLWCPDDWPLELWRLYADERARDLSRDEAFRSMWRRLVVALRRLGDEYVELVGDEVTRFIDDAIGSPGVAPPSTGRRGPSLQPPLAPGTHPAVKVADAVVGDPVTLPGSSRLRGVTWSSTEC